MTRKKADHLFVFAGYRSSGKSTALNIANHRKGNFPIFPAATMGKFMRVQDNQKGDVANAGFHRYDDFPKLARAPQDIMGIHYDLVMPIQNYAQAEFSKKATGLELALRSPKTWADQLRGMLADGSLITCLKQHYVQLVRLSSMYQRTDLSIIKTDWETNRADWISRFETQKKEKVSDRRKFIAHSFNIALFDEDIELGKQIYDTTHNFWFKTLKKSGARHLIVQRTGEHYDVKPVNFPIRKPK